MKKFTSTDLGGAPLFKSDMKGIFNDELWSVIQAQFSSFDSDTQGIVLSGCVTTNNSGNFDMTAGIVYLNGEFMRIAAVTNQAFTKYIVPSTPVNDDRTFEDGGVHTVAVTKGAQLSGSTPGSGQYLSIASLTDLDDRRWTPLGLTAWTTITPSAGWTANDFKYQRLGNSFRFKGTLQKSSVSGTSVTICNTPSDVVLAMTQPTTSIVFLAVDGSGNNVPGYLFFNTSGNVMQFIANTSMSSITLNVYFWGVALHL